MKSRHLGGMSSGTPAATIYLVTSPHTSRKCSRSEHQPRLPLPNACTASSDVVPSHGHSTSMAALDDGSSRSDSDVYGWAWLPRFWTEAPVVDVRDARETIVQAVLTATAEPARVGSPGSADGGYGSIRCNKGEAGQGRREAEPTPGAVRVAKEVWGKCGSVGVGLAVPYVERAEGRGGCDEPARVGVGARSANLVRVQHPHPGHPLRGHRVRDYILDQDGHAHPTGVDALLLLRQLRLAHRRRAATPAHRSLSPLKVPR
eukprot:scaffold24422_cov112-Isochrysis_galbana.AAC.7